MANERQLVVQLQNFLDSGAEVVTEELRELAQDYASACSAVNARLSRCLLYLNQGLRTEALHLAEASPPVLELAASLDFKGAEAWREFCVQQKLPVPDPISSDTISRLNEAYVQQQPLAALLGEYRRLAHVGTTRQKISVLRELVERDKENPNWRQDLVAVEAVRHEELAAETKTALTGEDIEEMGALIEELCSPLWSALPPEGLAESLRERIKQLRLKRAKVRAAQIAQSISEGYSSLDFDRTRAGLRALRALLAEGFTSLDPKIIAQATEARDWLDGEVRKRQEEAEFGQALKTLGEVLDHGAPRDGLERAVYGVNKFNRPIPDALRLRVERALADTALAETREFRLKMTVIGIVVAAVAIPVFLFVRMMIRDSECADWLKRIDAAREEKNFEAAEKLLADVQREAPKFYALPAFQERAAGIKDEEKAYRLENDLFSRTMQELEEIRAADFPADKPYTQLESLAERYAHSDSEKLRLAEWRAAKTAHEDKLQEQSDERFRRCMNDIIEKLKKIATLSAEKDPAAFDALLGQIEADFAAARNVANVSESLRNQLTDLRKQADNYAAAAKQVSEKQAAAVAMLSQMEQALPDLAKYEKALREFLELYPGHPETGRVQAALRDCSLGKDLLSGPPRMKAFASGDLAEINMFLASAEGRTSIWSEPLIYMRDRYVAGQKGITEVAKHLEDLKGNWRVHDLYTFTTTDTESKDITRYYYRHLTQKKTVSNNNVTISFYTIDVFGDGDEEVEKKFNTSAGDLNFSDNPDDNLAAHCKAVRALLAEMKGLSPRTCEETLLRNAEAIRRHPDIDPVMKVGLVQMLLQEARKVTFDNGRNIDALLAQLDDVNTNIYWMNYKPDKGVNDAKVRISKLLGKQRQISVMASGLAMNRRINEECLSAHIRCVGGVVKKDAELALEVNGPPPAEVWIVTPDKAGKPETYVVGTLTDKRTLKIIPAVVSKLYPGQPLFAWDGPPAADRARDILKDAPADAVKSIRWPRLWPVNARSAAPPAEGQ